MAEVLPNWALKTFGHGQLPLSIFTPNSAWYYLMVLGNLFESFKENLTDPVIPATVYADTFRRLFTDRAGKFIHRGGKLMMKKTRIVFEQLQLDRPFDRFGIGLPQWR